MDSYTDHDADGLDCDVSAGSWKKGRKAEDFDFTKQCLEVVFAEPRPWALQDQSASRSTAIKLALDF